MKREIKIIIALMVILLVGVGVVLKISNGSESEKVSIVATNFPAYDFARAVAGDVAEVKMLVKPGVEIHDFEPTPSDIIEIENSEIFIYNGGESDEWVKEILENAEAEDTRIFRMMDMVKVVEEETITGMEGEDEAGDDEHVWTSVRNAIKIVTWIRDELTLTAPENAEVFRKNAEEYLGELIGLDAEFQEVVTGGKRKVLVFGDRFPFRYFVDDYGLDYFAAFSGCAEQTEASSKTIAFLADKIKTEKIPVVLKIEMSSGEIAEAIARETGAKVLTFNSAHNISADDFRNGRTYAEIMKENLEVLREALK